jgi:hypothetical protein
MESQSQPKYLLSIRALHSDSRILQPSPLYSKKGWSQTKTQTPVKPSQFLCQQTVTSLASKAFPNFKRFNVSKRFTVDLSARPESSGYDM